MVSFRTNLIQDRSLYQYKTREQRISELSEKLATGKRINHSADDAAGLSIVTRMNSQKISDRMSYQNLHDGVSLTQVADGALKNTENILQRMRELALMTRNGTYSLLDKKSIQEEFKNLVSEIDSISKSTRFNQIYLLNPLVNSQVTNSYLSSDITKVQPLTLLSNTNWNKNINVSTIAKGLEVASNSFSPNTPLGLKGGFSLDGVTFVVDNFHTLDDIKNMVNSSGVSVKASIDSSNRLFFTSKQTGVNAVFSASDLNPYTNQLNVTNPNSADVVSNNATSSWSHTVEVLQMGTPAEMVKMYSHDFSVNDLSSKWSPLGGGSWSVSAGKLYQNNSGGMSNVFGLLANDTSTHDANRKVSVTATGMNAQFDAGVYVNYVNSNNFTRTWFDRGGGNKLYLEKMVNGISTVVSSANTTFQANKEYIVEGETDGLGNYTARVIDKATGSLVRNLNASGWTDAATTGGRSGIIGIQNPTNYDNFSVTSGYNVPATPTTYKMDGVSYSTLTNVISIPEGSIQLKNVGTSVITSTRFHSVLDSIGVLSGGTYQNVIQDAEDAVYSVGGTTYTQSGNQVMLRDTDNNPLGIVELLSTGSANVSNVNPNLPKEIDIHSGYAHNDVFTMLLSDVSSMSLGVAGTDYTDPFLLDRIDFALGFVTKERVKWGSYQNALSERSDMLSEKVIQTESSASRINDADIALVMSEKVKNEIMMKSTFLVTKESMSHTETYINLLQNS